MKFSTCMPSCDQRFVSVDVSKWLKAVQRKILQNFPHACHGHDHDHGHGHGHGRGHGYGHGYGHGIFWALYAVYVHLRRYHSMCLCI